MQETLSITQTLAREIAETRASDIPADAYAAAKRLVIDHVGITYMGYAFTGAALVEYARDLGGKPEAVLFGEGTRVPAELAAGINGQLCRNTDFEECGPSQHVGPLCTHVALAVGQRTRASGKEVLAALALGYVMGGRFHFARRADDTVPQMRTVAAAISARLLGLDSASTANALSLAWEFPYRAHVYTNEREPKRISPFGIGNLFHARAGVQAAMMARFAFESVSDEIDRSRDEYDVSVLTQTPTPFHYLAGEMELKPWICSRHSQGAMQALTDLVEENGIDAHDVTGLRLRLSFMYLRPHQHEPAPDTYWQAIYSTQWAAAMVLQRIPAGPQWVTPERLADPFSRHLAGLVEIIEDEESSAAFRDLRWLDIRGAAEVDSNGRTYQATRTMRETYGSPGADMPQAMADQKFFETTALCLDRQRAERLLGALKGIDSAADINDTAALF